MNTSILDKANENKPIEQWAEEDVPKLWKDIKIHIECSSDPARYIAMSIREWLRDISKRSKE